MSYKAPNSLPPEHINRGEARPLRELFVLLSGLVLIVGLLFALVWIVADKAALWISPEREVKWMSDWFAGDEPAGEELAHIFDGLLSVRPEPIPKLQLYISESKLPNAFIFPGGSITLTEGLLEQTDTENELAFVLAHELGHFVYRDSLRALSRSISMGLFLQMLGLADIEFLVGPTQIVELHYSREQERRADIFALELLNKRYGHIAGATDFFEKMKMMESSYLKDVWGYFSTHPMSDERIEAISIVAEEKGWSTSGDKIAFRWQAKK